MKLVLYYILNLRVFTEKNPKKQIEGTTVDYPIGRGVLSQN
jgi:hypothetical protein